MRSLAGYAVAAVGVVAASSGALWPWLDPAGRMGVLLAGGAALAAQVPALWVLMRSSSERFFGPWLTGMVFRLVAVAGVTALGVRLEGVALVPALLSLAGLLYVLLILEGVVFWRRHPTNRRSRATP